MCSKDEDRKPKRRYENRKVQHGKGSIDGGYGFGKAEET